MAESYRRYSSSRGLDRLKNDFILKGNQMVTNEILTFDIADVI